MPTDLDKAADASEPSQTAARGPTAAPAERPADVATGVVKAVGEANARRPGDEAAAGNVETATATPRSTVSVQVDARRHGLIQDKPAPAGDDEGMMASELLLASLLACQHSTFVKVAAKRRVDARVVRLEGELHFEGDVIVEARIHYTIDAPVATTDGQLVQVCRLTDRACTISKALSVPVNVSYRRNDSSR